MSKSTIHHGATVLGRWEWVALPEFGIACVKALIDPTRPVSAIRAVDVTAHGVEGASYLLRFRFFPLPEDPRTFVIVETSRVGASESRVRAESSNPFVLTELTIGEESVPVSLEVVETPGDFPLILGDDTVGRRFRVDSSREAVAGLPDLGWKPRSRPRPM